MEEYAIWLGMDLDKDKDLIWIAREGLKSPLPENWKPCKTVDTVRLEFDEETNVYTFCHVYISTEQNTVLLLRDTYLSLSHTHTTFSL